MTNDAASSLLVLSCDIVGSTAFKQAMRDWQRVFLSFYWDFPAALSQTCGEIDETLFERFELWKPLGDELLFICHVESELHVADAVRAWLAAMDKFEVDSLGSDGLTTKGGAFIATFPSPDSRCSAPLTREADLRTATDVNVRNEYALQENDRTSYHYDYFGPSFDTGFRVVAASTNRNFTMSVEVAWAMCQAKTSGDNDEDLEPRTELDDLAFLGPQSFKGVWRGREYPLFAIDRHHDDAVNQALLPVTGKEFTPAHVAKVCAACLNSPNWPGRLYLPKSSFGPFQQAPPSDQHPITGTHGVEDTVDEQELPHTTDADESIETAATN